MSISRLVLPKTRVRRSLFVLSCCFILVCCALVIQKIWVCCRDTSWHNNNNHIQCYLGRTVGIISLCSDIIGDTILVAVPVQMLWNVGLPRSQRCLVLTIFAASVLSTLAGIVYAVLVFNARILYVYRGLLIGLATDIMVSYL
ncbi:hypothetical protein BDZ94DRAFT_1263527 [Collybia nuda]|uniref:Rhodopsin domain-containing protein n=1 Tax=Collybia nuda TaxID=64659 RepID=A0A9P5Y136_9AGAR|nr:hypothetical protein BDZ94DRAFT_1263527 [Collybia nuda]